MDSNDTRKTPSAESPGGRRHRLGHGAQTLLEVPADVLDPLVDDLRHGRLASSAGEIP